MDNFQFLESKITPYQRGPKLPLKNGKAFGRQKEKGCHSKCQ